MRLPLNCSVDYVQDFLNQQESQEIWDTLINEYHLNTSRLSLNAGGKLVQTDSYKILFLSDELLHQGSHSEEIHGKRFAFTGILADLRSKVESYLDRKFDLAMCLYYPDGNHFAPYHSDQVSSAVHSILPSISLGAIREFSFKDKINNDTYKLKLADGSMLVMGEHSQSRYVHSLLKTPNCSLDRINITFREKIFQ